MRIKINGRVQGVGFRYAVERTAKDLGLLGWVKNQPDGSVMSVVQGLNAKIDELVDRCQKGFGRSRVDEIQVNPEPVDKKLAEFKIIF